MKKKILSLALALALCLGLAVPAFAETHTETIDGITFTADSNGTLTYSGSGKLTEYCAGYGAEYLLVLMDTANTVPDTVSINISSGITVDTQILEQIKVWLFNFGVKYVNINYGNSSTVAEPPVGGFTDVKSSDYFADPVVWAVGRNITAGTSKTTFSPNENCTVAQIVSFLWRAYGSPRSSVNNPFSDVKSSDYYYGAALWAYEKGMVTGGTFGGNRPCTRSMAVSYIWQAAGGPLADFDISNGYLCGYSGSGDLVIPDGVIGIVTGFSESAKEDLTSVTIPSSVTAGEWWAAFDGFKSLTSATIMPGVTSIDASAFANCSNLTAVTIPSTVVSIDVNAFRDCSSLTDVYYGGSQAQWEAVDLLGWGHDALRQANVHYNSKMPEQSQQPVNTGFTDVSSTADYAQAVKWAVDKGVTSGTSAATFSPDSVCTRAQIVSFLYRALAK